VHHWVSPNWSGRICSRLDIVVKGTDGNSAYPNPPVDIATVKAAGAAYAASIADALDGGKKALFERNKQRENVIHILRQLGRYVEINCKNDMGTFLSSGFECASKARVPSQPLTQPAIRSVEHGNAGQLLVSVTSVKGAYSYEVRYGAPAASGAAPASWLTTGFTSARSAAPVDSLTPGTTYVFQVRALGPLGYTDWSDAVNRMCT
jgi:hypothetical protein